MKRFIKLTGAKTNTPHIIQCSSITDIYAITNIDYPKAATVVETVDDLYVIETVDEIYNMLEPEVKQPSNNLVFIQLTKSEDDTVTSICINNISIIYHRDIKLSTFALKSNSAVRIGEHSVAFNETPEEILKLIENKGCDVRKYKPLNLRS